MFLHVIAVRHKGQYCLELVFNDSSIKDVDLTPELYGEVFEPLRDVEFFHLYSPLFAIYIPSSRGRESVWPWRSKMAVSYSVICPRVILNISAFF